MTCRTELQIPLCAALALFAPLACGDSGSADDEVGTAETGADTDTTGDGDTGESTTTTGDGDTSDTDSSESTMTGDGDTETSADTGESTTGDGDTGTDTGGTTTGDGDTGTGTGDTMTTTGDGDTGTDTGGTTGGFDFECDPDLDPIIVTLPNNQTARYPTIAAGVFAAPAEALVQICPGEYSETVSVELPITIEGAGPGLTTWMPEDGEALFVDAGVTVRGITFTGGTGGNPSGYNVTCGGALTIENSEAHAITLEDLVFDGNTAYLGGALCIDGGGALTPRPVVTIQSCSFVNNVSTGEGGAIHAYGRFHIYDSEILFNTGRAGGGIYLNYGCDQVDSCTIDTSVVENNTADGPNQYDGGGGLRIGGYFNGEAKITVTDSDFGFGVDQENSPDDVRTSDDSYGFYGDGVSFTCNGTCTAP